MSNLLAALASIFMDPNARAQGPDLSHWDGKFDPTQATESIDFAFMKLTEGEHYIDSAVESIWQGVKQVPVRGAYHYQHSGESWKLQADFFLAAARRFDFQIFALDLESRNNFYNDTFFADTRRIIDYWRMQAPTQKIVLYTNLDTYKQLYAAHKRLYPDAIDWLTQLDLWYAWPSALLTTPLLPTVRATWTFWQRSWIGTASQWGTNAATDVNVFNGTRDQLLSWIGISDQPAPEPDPQPVPDPYVEVIPETQLFEASVLSLSRVLIRNYPLRQIDTETGLFAQRGESFSGYLWPGNGYLWLKISQSPRAELIGKWVVVRNLDGTGNLVRLTRPLPPPTTNAQRYRVRVYGDHVMMTEAGLDYNLIKTSNFQNVPVYNKATNNFNAVSSYLRIPHEDVLRLSQLQVEDQYLAKQTNWRAQKMNWLCQYRGEMYMFDEHMDQWSSAAAIRWGTLKIGRNVVSVEDEEKFLVRVPGESHPRLRRMMRLTSFRKADWDRPLAELLALGLVDRCYCVYKNNKIGDTPKGIVYSPFWSPLDWDFAGQPQPQAFYLPYEWLELFV